MNNYDYQRDWVKPVIRIGTITMLLASLTMFLPLIYTCIQQGTWPHIGEILQGWALSAAAWGVFYFVEPITYYAVIGLSGTYLGFLAGNIGNLRIPCAATALEVTGVEPGSRHGELVATLAMSGSVITNIIFTTLAAIIGTRLLAVLPQGVVNAFSNYTVPAIFGAIVGQFAVNRVSLAGISVGVALFLKLVLKPSSFIEMLLSVVLVILIVRLLYNREKKEGINNERI